ncbi:MAG: hypothetical protein KGP14_03790 [Betaproteobacteria bacterium]|nr:hypothetical protein [Betaproteobacteria bacterium]
MSIQAPNQAQPISDQNGNVTTEWLQFFARLQTAINNNVQIPMRKTASLPKAANNPGTVFMLSDGVGVPVISNGTHWINFSGTVIV